MYFDQHLTISVHMDQLCGKAGKRTVCISTIVQDIRCIKQNASFYTVNLCGPFVAKAKSKKNEIFQNQYLRYVYDYRTTYQRITGQHRPLPFTNRLRRMVSFVSKCVKGKCPLYLNNLFQINDGSSSRRIIQNISKMWEEVYNNRVRGVRRPSQARAGASDLAIPQLILERVQ